MQIDKTTLHDLSIFHQDEEQSVFHQLNFTNTTGGRDWLRHMFARPFSSIKDITDRQNALQLIIQNRDQWPTIITNGTIMVVEKFYETPLGDIPKDPHLLSAAAYRYLNASEYSLVRYSVDHFADFVIGLEQLVRLLDQPAAPSTIAAHLNRIKALVGRDLVRLAREGREKKNISMLQYLTIGRFLRFGFKDEVLELIDIYSQMDALYSMALATQRLSFCFPDFVDSPAPFVSAGALFHPLLQKPISYNVALDQQKNFLFLTGANMAGKSTFIKAVGVAVYLAHLGMGTPAKEMRLSLFHGLLSNIQVEDNITRGESYFFNEVQRIRKTINKINDGQHWLILIDELFKGTNVQDAMRCSTAVIEGLIKMKNALFVLSTHLYEIADNLRSFSNIRFSYFETHVTEGQLLFSYTLKEGVSNDRLGYLILQREGVVEMLQNLG